MKTLIAITMAALALGAAAGTSSAATQAGTIEAKIRMAFPASVEGTMVCIARRESHLKPWAINWRDRHANGPGSFGLFQIGRIHDHYVGGNWRLLLNPNVNIRVARQIYLAERRAGNSGLGPWGGGC